MEGESTRQQKVGKQIQRDLAEIIQGKGMASFGGAMVTVTSVKVSPDLAVAKVYLSIFPSAKSQDTLKLVNAASRYIRGELGKCFFFLLRIVPELLYYVDDSLDYVERIDELLKK